MYWRNGKPIILPSLGGLMNNNALGINDLGQITGTSDLSGDLTGHATLWQNGTVQDLGTLSGDYSSYGEAINNLGQIVGSSCDVNYNCRAFFWEKGKMYDLNTLIPSNPNLSLTLGATIDDAGVIGGYGYDQTASTYPAFVALPVLLFKGTRHPQPQHPAKLLPGFLSREYAFAAAEPEETGDGGGSGQISSVPTQRCGRNASTRIDRRIRISYFALCNARVKL